MFSIPRNFPNPFEAFNEFVPRISEYRYNKDDWQKSIQPIVDEICEKYNLSRLEDDTGLSLEQTQIYVKIPVFINWSLLS